MEWSRGANTLDIMHPLVLGPLSLRILIITIDAEFAWVQICLGRIKVKVSLHNILEAVFLFEGKKRPAAVD